MVPTAEGVEDWFQQSIKLGQKIKTARNNFENSLMPIQKTLTTKRNRSKSKGFNQVDNKKTFNYANIVPQFFEMEKHLSPDFKKVPEMIVLKLNKPTVEISQD